MANALGLRIMLALASGTLAVLLVPWIAPDQAGLRPLVALGALGLLFAAQPGYRALLRAQLRLGDLLVVAAISNGLLLVLVAGALIGGTDLAGVFVAIAAAALAGFGLAAILSRQLFAFRIAVELGTWWALLRAAWPIGANLFVIMLGLRVAPLFLMTYRGPIEVGYLASATRLAEALNLLADGLMLAVFPVFSRLALASAEALRDLARVSTKLLALVLLAVVLALSELSPLVLRVLFGPEFAAAAPALVLLSWFGLLAGLGTVYANLLVALGSQRVLFGLNAVSAVGQIVLQLFLVSRFGLLGAAGGAVLASAANHVALYFLPATRRWIRPCVHGVAGMVAITAALLFLAPALPLTPVVRGLALPIALVLLSLATRQLGATDVDALRKAVAVR
jgi:O-antigen/teichoic acid export membrane protein